MKRYIFVSDDSGHWYYIPLEYRLYWNVIDWEDESSWELPEWAVRLNGDVSLVSFTDPQEIN